MNALTRNRVVFVLALTLAVAVAIPAQAGAKVPRDFLGISSVDTFYGSSHYKAKQLKRQHAAGIGLLRVQFHWKDIEKRRGVYSYGLYDKIMVAAAKRRIRVMPLLFDPPKFLTSGSGGQPGAMYPPDNPADMGHFAAVMAARYGRGGSFWKRHPKLRQVPVHSWQVWNEPNLPVYWAPKPNAVAYTRMLQSVSPSIKGIDPKAEILTGGIPASKLKGAIRLSTFVRGMYSAGAKSGFDTLAVNTYAPNTRGFVHILRVARKLMRNAGDGKSKVYASEFGWASAGPKHRFRVGSRGQARRIASTIRWAGKHRRGAHLRGILYFAWRDSKPYAPKFKDMWGLHTGLLGRSGKAKPALRAFRRAAHSIRR